MKRTLIASLLLCALSVTVRAQEALPALKVETLATPVVTARLFEWGWAPDTEGHWYFIGQFMNYKSTGGKEKVDVPLPGKRHYLAYADTDIRPEAEWVMADLTTGASKIAMWPGFHCTQHVLAENGRVFFAVDYAHIYYWDPTEKTVKPMDRLRENINELRSFYKLVMGPDGMVYIASQSTNGVATVAQLNPDTLEYKIIDNVGVRGRRDLTYGYYLAADPPWAYVAVGQGEWELWAVNFDTNEKKMLAERVNDKGARVTVSQGEGFCAAQLIGPPERLNVILQDGKIVASGAPGVKLEYTPKKAYPHIEWKMTKPLDAGPLPEIDKARPVAVNAQGIGEVFYKLAGDQDWRRVAFQLKNTEASNMESLTLLPDGSLLGSVQQYNGWFRYYPAEAKLDYFGKAGPSGARTAIADGKVYICGYPNTVLSVYDPTKPWRKPADAQGHDPEANPLWLGTLGQGRAESHHAVTLLNGGNGRIYLQGQRERWSTGTGLGYYEIATKKWGFLGQENKDLEPGHMIVLPKAGRLIVSGGKRDAPLLVYDMDLNEVEKITLVPELKESGLLWSFGAADEFLGCYTDPQTEKHVLYVYSLSKKTILRSTPLDNAPQVLFRPDGSAWALAGGVLSRLNVNTLGMTPVGTIEGGMRFALWTGKDIYAARGGTLVKVSVP